MSASSQESGAVTLQDARDRVSFLEWALRDHRSPQNMRNAFWKKLEADFVRQLEQARMDLERLDPTARRSA